MRSSSCSSCSACSACGVVAFVLLAEFAGRRPPRLRDDPAGASYSVELSALPPTLASTFVSSHIDAETREFLASCRADATSLLGRWAIFLKHKLFVALIERCGWTRVDASSFVGRGRLFVASREQLGRVLQRPAWRVAAPPNLHRRLRSPTPTHTQSESAESPRPSPSWLCAQRDGYMK